MKRKKERKEIDVLYLCRKHPLFLPMEHHSDTTVKIGGLFLFISIMTLLKNKYLLVPLFPLLPYPTTLFQVFFFILLVLLWLIVFLAKDTTYTCTPVDLPYGQKYHIVRWRPVITPGMEQYVHHMVLFSCPSSHPPDSEPFECEYEWNTELNIMKKKKYWLLMIWIEWHQEIAQDISLPGRWANQEMIGWTIMPYLLDVWIFLLLFGIPYLF